MVLGNSPVRVGSCQMSVPSTSCPEVGQGRETRTSLWDRKLPVDKWEKGEMLGVNRFSSISITQPASISWVLSVAGHQATCFVDKLSERLPTPLGQVHFPTPVLRTKTQRFREISTWLSYKALEEAEPWA